MLGEVVTTALIVAVMMCLIYHIRERSLVRTNTRGKSLDTHQHCQLGVD